MTTSLATQARTATLVVVGSSDRLAEAATMLGRGEEAGALRIVLISTDSAAPAIDVQPDVVSIAGLRPEYVNNAIAGVRLSSLPTVVWWRGGMPDELDGVAALADRVVLDAEDPWSLWSRAPALFEQTALTDLRWARLTRWRAAMAHFFDLPEIRTRAASFAHLCIAGSDAPQCALFAGWLDTALEWNGRAVVEFVAGAAPLASVVLGGDAGELVLQLLPNRTCLDTHARLPAEPLASRVVALGDQQLHSILSEELRVRARDLAFERALQSPLLEQARGR